MSSDLVAADSDLVAAEAILQCSKDQKIPQFWHYFASSQFFAALPHQTDKDTKCLKIMHIVKIIRGNPNLNSWNQGVFFGCAFPFSICAKIIVHLQPIHKPHPSDTVHTTHKPRVDGNHTSQGPICCPCTLHKRSSHGVLPGYALFWTHMEPWSILQCISITILPKVAKILPRPPDNTFQSPEQHFPAYSACEQYSCTSESHPMV